MSKALKVIGTIAGAAALLAATAGLAFPAFAGAAATITKIGTVPSSANEIGAALKPQPGRPKFPKPFAQSP